MSLVPSSPMSIGQVLDLGFKLYRKSLPRLLPFMLISGLLGMLPGLIGVMTGGIAGTQSPMSHAMSLFAAVAGLILAGSYITVINDVAYGRTGVDFAAAAGAGARAAPRILGSAILYGLVLVVGLVLLVIPGLILLMSLIFASLYVVLENAGPVESLKLSRALVKGHWWRVTAVMTAATFIFVAILVGLGALVGLLLPLTGAVSKAGSDEGVAVIGLAIIFVINGVMTAFLTPYFYATYIAAYRDLKLRKSGFDLAERIAAAA